MIGFSGRGRDSEPAGPDAPPSDAERDAAAVALEAFDFEHPVFREDTWAEIREAAELPEPVGTWVDQLRTLVARQAGAKEILAALGDTMLDRDQDADRYVDDRLVAGETRDEIRADVQAVHDALETRIHEVTFPEGGSGHESGKTA